LPLPTQSDFGSGRAEKDNEAIESALSQISAGTMQEFHEISIDISQPSYFYQAEVVSTFTDGGSMLQYGNVLIRRKTELTEECMTVVPVVSFGVGLQITAYLYAFLASFFVIRGMGAAPW
jgi:hypothetical protein